MPEVARKDAEVGENTSEKNNLIRSKKLIFRVSGLGGFQELTGPNFPASKSAISLNREFLRTFGGYPDFPVDLGLNGSKVPRVDFSLQGG